MAHITLSKAVGKQAYGASGADIKTLQCCLASLKFKSKFGSKPFYAGKTDGKVGPKTIAAIECFQDTYRFKVTGKILPGSPEIRKLREKTNITVLKDIERATMGEVTAGPASQDRQKSIRAAAQASGAVKTKAPIPKDEAADLAKLIEAAAKKGVPLKIEQVDIDAEGRFTVLFSLTYSALPDGIPKATADGIAVAALKDLSRASLKWHQPNQSKLSVVTRMAYDFLKGVTEQSREYLERMGLQVASIDPARKKLLAAAEQLELRKIGL